MASDDPASLQLLVNALQSASSSDAPIREAATAYLEASQHAPGFPVSLLTVVGSRHQLGDSIRTQAVLYFKNSLDGTWRRGTGAK